MKHIFAMESTKKLNFFPAANGVSPYYSPRMIMHYEALDYNETDDNIEIVNEGNDDIEIDNNYFDDDELDPIEIGDIVPEVKQHKQHEKDDDGKADDEEYPNQDTDDASNESVSSQNDDDSDQARQT
jgi:hypothetical protein